MLRKSLHNYAKVKAASSNSRGSSEYANCKENTPIHGDLASLPSQYSVCRPNSDKTPISRFDHKKAIAQSSWPAGPVDERLNLTVIDNKHWLLDPTLGIITKHTASVVLQPVSSDAGAASTRSTVSA